MNDDIDFDPNKLENLVRSVAQGQCKKDQIAEFFFKSLG